MCTDGFLICMGRLVIYMGCLNTCVDCRGRMVTGSDNMRLSGSTWLRGISDLLLPLVTDLNARLLARARDFPDAGDHDDCPTPVSWKRGQAWSVRVLVHLAV